MQLCFFRVRHTGLFHAFLNTVIFFICDYDKKKRVMSLTETAVSMYPLVCIAVLTLTGGVRQNYY